MSKGKGLGQLIERLGTDWTLRVELLSLVALSGAQLVRGGIAQRVRLQSGRKIYNFKEWNPLDIIMRTQ